MRESSSHFEPGKWLSASPRTLLSAGRLRYFKNQTFTEGFRLFFLFICKNLGAGAIHFPRAFEIPKGGGRLRPPEPKKKDTLKRVFLFGLSVNYRCRTRPGPRTAGRRVCAVRVFCPQAKTSAQAEFISAEHFNISRYPKRNTSLLAGVSFWR